MTTTRSLRKARSASYTTARLLGDVIALLSGRFPQRLARRAVYRETNRATRALLRAIRL